VVLLEVNNPWRIIRLQPKGLDFELRQLVQPGQRSQGSPFGKHFTRFTLSASTITYEICIE
jgi:hypothetical protein